MIEFVSEYELLAEFHKAGILLPEEDEAQERRRRVQALWCGRRWGKTRWAEHQVKMVKAFTLPSLICWYAERSG